MIQYENYFCGRSLRVKIEVKWIGLIPITKASVSTNKSQALFNKNGPHCRLHHQKANKRVASSVVVLIIASLCRNPFHFFSGRLNMIPDTAARKRVVPIKRRIDEDDYQLTGIRLPFYISLHSHLSYTTVTSRKPRVVTSDTVHKCYIGLHLLAFFLSEMPKPLWADRLKVRRSSGAAETAPLMPEVDDQLPITAPI